MKFEMPLLPPAQLAAAAFARAKASRGRALPTGLLALDVSPLRIGVACCDGALSEVLPVGVVSPRETALVTSLAVKYGAMSGIVV